MSDKTRPRSRSTVADPDVLATTEFTPNISQLRVGDPKSKQRALSREFGLDTSKLTDTEITQRRFELAALINMGKAALL